MSPFLFTLIFDELTRTIHDGVPYYILFANDIVPQGESKERIIDKMKQWRVALESKGQRMSRTMTEYLKCMFRSENSNFDIEVNIGSQSIPDNFKYLGSIIEIDEDITNCIKASGGALLVFYVIRGFHSRLKGSSNV